MDAEVLDIRREARDLGFYSRGSLSYTDALNLSPPERKLFNEMIKDHLDTTKKTGLSFF